MKTHSHPLFFGGGRDSTSPIFQHTKPKLSVWLDSFGDKWEEECLFFLIKRMNWPSEARGRCFHQENGSTNNARRSRECKRKWLHSSVPHTFLCFTSWYSQHCWADIISALCERPLPNNTASYRSHEEKKRHKDWMSDTFVHFCVTEDRRSILLVQLYWWNINKATMPLLKAGTSPVCTDLKPWQ